MVIECCPKNKNNNNDKKMNKNIDSAFVSSMHWDWDKMAVFFGHNFFKEPRLIFTKIFFTKSVFSCGDRQQILGICLGTGLGPKLRQTLTWTDDDLVQWLMTA